MNRLRGQDGFEVYIEKKVVEGEKKESVIETMIEKDPEGNSLSGKIYYFYGCGQKEGEIKEKAGTKRKLALYQFIRFFGQETMEHYGVKFFE